MSLYRHRQIMMILCFSSTTIDQLSMQVIFIELLTSHATAQYVNGIVGRDTRELGQFGHFVMVQQNRVLFRTMEMYNKMIKVLKDIKFPANILIEPRLHKDSTINVTTSTKSRNLSRRSANFLYHIDRAFWTSHQNV